MKTHYIIVLNILISITTYLRAELPSVVNGSLQEFMSHVVNSEDTTQFSEFYESLLKHEAILRQKKNEKVLAKHKREQMELGRCSLEVRNSDLYISIKPYLDSTNKQTQKDVERFLYRYGAYEKYIQQKSSYGQPILVKAQRYANEMKNRVVSFAHRLDPRRIFNY